MLYTDSKEVDFVTYCHKCKYEKEPEGEEPCNTCLETGGRLGTRVPTCFKPKDEKGTHNA